MSEPYNEAVAGAARELAWLRVVAETYPDVHRAQLPSGVFAFTSKAAAEDTEGVSVSVGNRHKREFFTGQESGVWLVPFAIVDQKPVYVVERAVDLHIALMYLEKEHPDAYAKLVAVVKKAGR